MAEGEKFNIGKFFAGFVSPITNAKNIQFVLWLAIIGFAGFTIWRAFFLPTQHQQQSNIIQAQPGATVNIGQTQKQEEKKRAWWLPRLFGEIYAFQETDRNGVGAKGGLHWEF